MISNGAIFRIVPYPPGAVGIAPGSVPGDPAFLAANLANVQPKVVLRTLPHGANAFLVVDIDLGADTPIDGLAVLHTRFSGGAGWAILGATAGEGPLPLPLGTEPAARRLFSQTSVEPFGFAPTTREDRRVGLILGTHIVRWLRIYFFEPLAQVTEIGTLLVLQRLAMGQTWDGNFELGSGRRVDDRSQVRTLPGGETAIERGGRVPVWRAAWSNLTEAQYRQLWSLLMEVGTGAPILAAEFQDRSPGQAEALHYGLIQSIDFSERVQLDKQRIELRIQELV